MAPYSDSKHIDLDLPKDKVVVICDQYLLAVCFVVRQLLTLVLA